jgi:coiled-coil domain-containing protein 40
MQVAQLQNELSKMRVDSLGTQAHVQTLEQELASILEELREKDRLVEKYEQEIRRRNDEIERKQSEVDRLNRKYDQLSSNHQVFPFSHICSANWI